MTDARRSELKRTVDENKEEIARYLQTGDEKFLNKPTVEEKKLSDTFKERILAYIKTGDEKLWNELTTTVKETKSSAEIENLINAFHEAKNHLNNIADAEILPDALSCAAVTFAITTPPSMCFLGVKEGLKTGCGLGFFGGITGMVRSITKHCDRGLSPTLRIIDRNIETLSDMLEMHRHKYLREEAQRNQDNFSASNTFGMRNRSN